MALHPAIVIIAHGKRQHVFDALLPIWRGYKLPILVFCPENDPIKGTGFEVVPVGVAGHSGDPGVDRWKKMIPELISRKHNFYYIFEYDSMWLGKLPAPKNGLSGVVKPVWPFDFRRWIARKYPNPPWFVDLDSLKRMWSVWKRYPDIAEEGQADRILAALATLSNVPIFNLPGHTHPGGSNTELPNFYASIVSGGQAFHGPKQVSVLEKIIEFYEQYHTQNRPNQS